MEKYLLNKQFTLSGVVKLTKAEVDSVIIDFGLSKLTPFYDRLKKYLKENKDIESGIWVITFDKKCLVRTFDNSVLSNRIIVNIPENTKEAIKMYGYSDLFSEAILL